MTKKETGKRVFHKPPKVQHPKKNQDKKFSKSEPSGVALRIPPILERLINSYILKKTGKDSIDPVLLSRMRQSVMAQKASYWKDKPGKNIKYGRAYDIFAYVSYHLPVYFTQFRQLVSNLYTHNVIPKSVTLFDIGSGPGVVPLAMIDFWKEKGEGSLDIYALERSEEHIEAFNHFTSAFIETNPSITVHPVLMDDLTTWSPEKCPQDMKPATIISFQNVIAELEHISIGKRAEIVLGYSRLLADDGFLIIVEPAEMRHATSLRRLQNELIKGGLHVYAPCSYLWGSVCDPKNCWTFQEDESIQPTELMNLLAGETEGYRFINTDIKYAYLILTKKESSRCNYRVPKKTRMVRLSQIHKFERRLISVAGARMSADIGNHGMHIFKICDGTCREPVYVVLSRRNRRPNHSALFSSSYGDILLFSDVQVRRHEKHEAWNIIVSADSRIERAQSTGVHTDNNPGNKTGNLP